MKKMLARFVLCFCFLYTIVHLIYDLFPQAAIPEKRILLNALLISVVFIAIDQYREKKKKAEG